jgi:hypothetical protein
MSRAQVDGQSCGQAEWATAIPAVMFMHPVCGIRLRLSMAARRKASALDRPAFLAQDCLSYDPTGAAPP